MNRDFLRTLLRAWLVITVVDGIFATVLPVVAYGAPLGRVWQGVASLLLGPSAMGGGGRTILFGLVMHASVAFTWTTVFLALALASATLRRIIERPTGILAVSAIYGPAIWVVMSFVVIRTVSGRTPVMNDRWWVQFFAHIPFVAVPIVAVIGRGLGTTEGVVRARPVGGTA